MENNNGELPYKDIIIVRPPFSIFFHTLSLIIIPTNYVIIFERFFFYFLMASASLFGSLSIYKVFEAKTNEIIHPFLLATLGFIFSVHNYPPMAWHTIDGIFFASLGVYILVSSCSILSIPFGMLFLFLSALCKQPFYLMPVFGLFYIYFLHKKNNKKILYALSALLIYTGIFFTIFYKLNIWNDFIRQTSGSTDLKNLLIAGFMKYLEVGYSIYFILFFTIWLILRKVHENKKKAYTSMLPYIFLTILFTIHVFGYINLVFLSEKITFKFSDSISHTFFILTFFLLIEKFSIEKRWLTLFFLTLISWCASISWGYCTPTLFSLPLLFGFLFIAKEYFHVKKASNLAIYMIIWGLAIYFVAYQKPFHNPLRTHINKKIDNFFPKLQGIRVSENTYKKYQELYYLVNKYGTNFKTLPGMPLTNYLTDSNSPIPLDWVFNAETSNYNEEIIQNLENQKTTVFLEKNPVAISISDSNEKFNSSVAYYISQNWDIIEQTTYFYVFKYKK